MTLVMKPLRLRGKHACVIFLGRKINHLTEGELAPCQGSAFIEINFLNCSHSFTKGNSASVLLNLGQCQGDVYCSKLSFSARYDTNKDQWKSQVCVHKVAIKCVDKQISFAYLSSLKSLEKIHATGAKKQPPHHCSSLLSPTHEV